MVYKKYGNYELHPMTKIVNHKGDVVAGYDQIFTKIQSEMIDSTNVLICDFYPGVNSEEVEKELEKLNPSLFIRTQELLFDFQTLDKIFEKNITDDRVFGYMSDKKVEDCFDPAKVESAKEKIAKIKNDLVVVVGVGAYSIWNEGLFVYFDMARWEIQTRFKNGATNWLAENPNDPFLTKYKRGFFIEWRLADRYKVEHFKDMDFVVDTNIANNPKMVEGEVFLKALTEVSQKPFRMQPYFDPGVWGGQWMKNNFNLDPKEKNYAWSFDGIPEENSINLEFENGFIEVPSNNIVLYAPDALLGERVYARFGRAYPIRFNLLDTMEGQNLSLQVHPLEEYIQETFGMHYTQEESYYLLDAKEGAFVYLGLKENVDSEQMKRDLKIAEKGTESFDAEKYINKFPVKKHDHVLIPPGTIHCSGSNSMVLEISATPFVYTFKLWDWDRLGLDGLPRPIHLEHGFKNIQWDRTTSWVEEHLLHRQVTLEETETYRIERTGLHESEFIETLRIYTTDDCVVKMNGSAQSANLVEGKEAQIVSINGSFEPFTVHYAETFIIPESVKSYILKAIDSPVTIIVAQVRK